MAYPGPKGNLLPKAAPRRSVRHGLARRPDARRRGLGAVGRGDRTDPGPDARHVAGRTKPGAEARRGTFRFQDVDDEWRRMVWGFCQARKAGNRQEAAEFPEFNVITQIDDVGAPAKTRWSLLGCTLYSYSGGFSQEDQLLVRDVPSRSTTTCRSTPSSTPTAASRPSRTGSPRAGRRLGRRVAGPDPAVGRQTALGDDQLYALLGQIPADHVVPEDLMQRALRLQGGSYTIQLIPEPGATLTGGSPVAEMQPDPGASPDRKGDHDEHHPEQQRAA